MDKELKFDDLALIAAGHTAFQLLWSGLQLGLFDFLSANPGASRDQIMKHADLQEQPARILLIGLTTLKLIKKEGDGYRNADVVAQVLVSNSPAYMGDVLGWQYHIVYPGEMDLLRALQENTNVGLGRFTGTENNLYDRLSHTPELEKIFHDAMSSLSKSANVLLAEEVPLTSISHLVDAGGGDGTNAITLAKANPHLKVTVFDSPTVCALAEQNIREAGMGDRVDTFHGNLFNTDLPTGIDAILLAHMMTIWSPEHDTTVLKKAYDALPAGGRVIVFNMMGNDDEDGPITAALGSPYFLSIATGEGMLYTWKDYESFMDRAGFKKIERISLPRDHGVLIGIKQ